MYTDLVSVSALISEDVKDQAKAIAEEWKPKLDSLDVDANNGNSLEAHAFLQLLATFGIASDFDVEEISRLIPMVSRRRQAAELCRFLGLSERMPGLLKSCCTLIIVAGSISRFKFENVDDAQKLWHVVLKTLLLKRI
jgi:hypothetical protein